MLRKTPLKRGKPLKRTAFKRSRPKPNPAGSDPAHLAHIRTLPCCSCGAKFGVVSHHSTVGRGLSQKTSDHETMPLCRRCHASFHLATGFFEGWSREDRRQWQRRQVEVYRPKESA